MITISVCMIVKNEEKVLARCLDCFQKIADEIIIVDTGSSDRTKEIAKNYTDKIYDFEWKNDFSMARNFSFSKATCEYIYQADADEVIDEENQILFQQLKEVLLPEIDIVQMKYKGQLQCGTVYNFDEEYRPKLFKRLREFVWEEPVHETVRLTPVVYDSNLTILHMADENHASRDFSIFLSMQKKQQHLSNRLHHMYAQELFISGTDADFIAAQDIFLDTFYDDTRTKDEELEAACVLARCYRVKKEIPLFFKYALKCIAWGGCSEVCYELGVYYYEMKDYEEALQWLTLAVTGTESILAIKYAEVLAPELINQIQGEIQ